jgi:hypothetical protein
MTVNGNCAIPFARARIDSEIRGSINICVHLSQKSVVALWDSKPSQTPGMHCAFGAYPSNRFFPGLLPTPFIIRRSGLSAGQTSALSMA